MKKKDVVAFFGTSRATARALGLSERAVNEWKDEVPKSRRQAVIDAARNKLDGMIDQLGGWIAPE